MKRRPHSSSVTDEGVTEANAALNRGTTELEAKFSLMEGTIAKLQSQGQRLSGLSQSSRWSSYGTRPRSIARRRMF